MIMLKKHQSSEKKSCGSSNLMVRGAIDTIQEKEEKMAAPKGNCFNPAGRPQKPIDWKEFEKLCAMQCTQSEIASFLEIHPETLSIRVREEYKEDYPIVYKRFSEHGKCSLRRTQLKLAQKNTAMAIWLGKQYLDQKDTPQEVHASEQLNKQFESVMNQISQLQTAKNDPNQALAQPN